MYIDKSTKKSCKGKNLKKFLGILKGDKEYNKLLMKLKEDWSAWQKRYI